MSWLTCRLATFSLDPHEPTFGMAAHLDAATIDAVVVPGDDEIALPIRPRRFGTP